MEEEFFNPLVKRYASKEMLEIFSNFQRIKTWRRLWIVLAETQMELGLPFIDAMDLEKLKEHEEDIDFKEILELEKKYKHEVMTNVYAFGKKVGEKAKKIIHLGATSAYVIDNCDLIVMKKGLGLLFSKLLRSISLLKEFALKHKSIATLGFTHFQSAQPTTVGKRAANWLYSILENLKDLEELIKRLPFRGVKGASGTQASFQSLFQNDFEKVKQLDSLIAKKMGFEKTQKVSGQTYDRNWDTRVLNALSLVAESLHKITNDIRLLQGLKELEEPFAEEQIGSSAMPYKRNPVKCERIASLSKYVISLKINASFVASTQWLERSLDDSANKRITISGAFLSVDAAIDNFNSVIKNLKIYKKNIESNLQKELPFMITEKIIADKVKDGADRQEIHSIIRDIAMKANQENESDFLSMLEKHPKIMLKKELIDPKKYIGFAELQVDDLIKEEVNPFLEEYKNLIESKEEDIKI